MVSFTGTFVTDSSKMGCASSSPLMESGKNLVDTAKDQAGDVVNKGEKTLHDVGDKITTEMDNVKGAMKSAFTTAENSIGSVMGQVTNNVNSTASDVKETVNNMEEEAEDALNAVSDSANEAVSEAETVLASEAENAKEMISTKASEAFDKAEETKEAMEDKAHEMQEKIEDALHIEDMEHQDVLGDSVNNVEKKTEEIVAKLSTPAASPVKEPQKEEPPPTCWEAAADAIVEQKSFSSSMDLNDDKENVSTDNILESINEDMRDVGKEVSEKVQNEFLQNESLTKINTKSC